MSFLLNLICILIYFVVYFSIFMLLVLLYFMFFYLYVSARTVCLSQYVLLSMYLLKWNLPILNLKWRGFKYNLKFKICPFAINRSWCYNYYKIAICIMRANLAMDRQNIQWLKVFHFKESLFKIALFSSKSTPSYSYSSVDFSSDNFIRYHFLSKIQIINV